MLLDGSAVSLHVFAVQANGKQLMTVEGLEQDGTLHPLQEGFSDEHGLQCGFCTPGMLMTSFAFLQKNSARAKRYSFGDFVEISAGAPAT